MVAVFAGGAAVGDFAVFIDEGRQGPEGNAVAGSSAEDPGRAASPFVSVATTARAASKLVM